MKSDEVLIRELLVDEETAVKNYINAAEKVKNNNIQKVLYDIANEERVHIGELIRCLDELNISDKSYIHQGEDEANEILLSDMLNKIQIILNSMAYKRGEQPTMQVAVIDTVEVEPSEKAK